MKRLNFTYQKIFCVATVLFYKIYLKKNYKCLRIPRKIAGLIFMKAILNFYITDDQQGDDIVKGEPKRGHQRHKHQRH